MESARFDAFVKHLHVLISRRDGLRVLLAGLAAGTIGVATADDAAAFCVRKGRPCIRDRQCCSRRCFSKKRMETEGKGKNRHLGEKKELGKCTCSDTRQSCHVAADCCFSGDACGTNSCGESNVCCTAAGFPCKDNCDCCGFNVCLGGTCQPQPQPVPCSQTQEPCSTADDCCSPVDACGSNAAACGAAGTVCCRPAGAACGQNCDCCVPFQCDGESGTCVAPCNNSGASCNTAAECCAPQFCSVSACGGTNLCCSGEAGPCVTTCDCCEGLVCNGVECQHPGP